MISGIGIDIIEIDRIKKAIQRQAFIEKVFTEQERLYCESRGCQRTQSYAARFAGKEAILKAFGTGLREGRLLDMEILPDDLGCPQVKLYGYFANKAREIGVSRILISLTHSRDYAAAQVVFWGGERNEDCNSG